MVKVSFAFEVPASLLLVLLSFLAQASKDSASQLRVAG
jgi:hypothetical protein